MTRALFSPRCRAADSVRTHGFDLRFLFVIAITCIGLVSAAVAPAFAASITTNKTEYVPGEIVEITGTGWQAGEAVTIVITETPVIHGPITKYATADGSGNFTNTEYSPEAHDVGQQMTVTATGSSGAVATAFFADANANLDQGKNEKASAPVNPVQWVNGNLN